MLPAARRGWFVRWMGWYTERLLRQQFAGIVCLGDPHPFPASQNTIVLLNHISWWDGLLVLWLQRHRWRRPTFAWMEQRHLRTFAFFRWLGGIGIGSGPKEMRQALRYVGELFRLPGQILAIFPQGKECLDSARPWQFAKGPAWLIEHMQPVQVRLVCLRYVFLGESKPWIGLYCDPLPLLQHQVADQEQRMERAYQLLEAYFLSQRQPETTVELGSFQDQPVEVIRFGKPPSINWPTSLLARWTWWWDGKQF